MKRRKQFTPEDRHLWKRVAETTTPLSQQRDKTLKEQLADFMGDADQSVPPTVARSAKPASYNVPRPPAHAPKPKALVMSHPIEDPVAKKLAKGRLPIDARIDLHGMTQDRARFALLDFLEMAQLSDWRIILVITGKGHEGQGVLRKNVPQWLTLPDFKRLVNGVRVSHVSHGGEGALYVRVRKK